MASSGYNFTSSIQFYIDGNDVAAMQEKLKGVDGGLRKAAYRALERTGENLRTNTSRYVRQRYDITKENLEHYSHMRKQVRHDDDGATVGLTYSGDKLPLQKFKNSAPNYNRRQAKNVHVLTHGKRWITVHPSVQASAHVLVGNHNKLLFGSENTTKDKKRGGFWAKMKSGHVGFFRRTGERDTDGTEKITELFAPSFAEMLGHNDVYPLIEQESLETFQKRIRHEADFLAMQAAESRLRGIG